MKKFVLEELYFEVIIKVWLCFLVAIMAGAWFLFLLSRPVARVACLKVSNILCAIDLVKSSSSHSWFYIRCESFALPDRLLITLLLPFGFVSGILSIILIWILFSRKLIDIHQGTNSSECACLFDKSLRRGLFWRISFTASHLEPVW